ncbi:MAG: hypothetical protein KGM99_16430 [Burkholderiales bacterium]|nr:hypothetical protein [Burkholderiales bacterium]
MLLALLILAPLLVLAAPADWYRWRSKIDQSEVCSQTSPGDGWEKFSGPYRDARCEKPKRKVDFPPTK